MCMFYARLGNVIKEFEFQSIPSINELESLLAALTTVLPAVLAATLSPPPPAAAIGRPHAEDRKRTSSAAAAAAAAQEEETKQRLELKQKKKEMKELLANTRAGNKQAKKESREAAALILPLPPSKVQKSDRISRAAKGLHTTVEAKIGAGTKRANTMSAASDSPATTAAGLFAAAASSPPASVFDDEDFMRKNSDVVAFYDLIAAKADDNLLASFEDLISVRIACRFVLSIYSLSHITFLFLNYYKHLTTSTLIHTNYPHLPTPARAAVRPAVPEQYDPAAEGARAAAG